MKIFSDHKIWWGALAIGSLIVATQTTSDLGIGGILGKSTGMLLFSLVLGGRDGSVILNSLQAVDKWLSALVMPPPGWAWAG